MIEYSSTKNSKSNKQDYAYEKIKEWIIKGDFPADMIVVERQVCEKLGMSRTPVRSALQKLEKDGFLVAMPGRGMMVSRVRIEDVVETFEIRCYLDVLALELFMKQNKKDIITQMRQTVTDMKTTLEEDDYVGFIYADNHFHELYTQNSGNKRLEKMCDELTEMQQRILAETSLDFSMRESAYKYHAAIMDKIESGDVKEASKLLRQHLEEGMEYHIRKMVNKI